MKVIIKLIPYYWIIQGILIVITIRGCGSLPLIGCILLIICTVLYQKVNVKYAKVFSILYMLYSILFIIMLGIVFLFFGFYNIHLLILIIAILNVILSLVQFKYSDKYI